MDDATLARLEHENMHAWMAVSFPQVPGALVRHEAGVGVYATGLPVPLFNQVVTDDDATEASARAAVGELRARGAPFAVVLRRDRDARFEPLMVELGLRRSEHPLPGMALEPIPTDLPTTAAGLEIQVVHDATALRDHALVAARSFGVAEPVALAIIGEGLWRRPGATVYTGYAEGRPVACGYSVRSGATLGIFTIATVPEARKRGFGAAMTGRLARDGAAAGCELVTLQASDMGRPIYERMGFRVVQEYDLFVG